MKLADIIKNTDCNIIQDTDKEILSVVYDSRKVTEGSVFVAVSGETTDGARYVGDAVRGGAVAVVSQKSVPVPEGIGCIMADDTRFALGAIAKNFYGNPSAFMKLTGITGTSGKTTVSNVLYNIFKNKGIESGLIGTISNKFGNVEEPAVHTTPQAADLQEILFRMKEAGVGMCAMEVSSHALDQGRVFGAEFDCGVFLNIERDHLDYHKTIENYRNAKLKLFGFYPKHQSKDFVAVVNNDAGILDYVREVFQGKIITFGRNDKADVYSSNEKIFIDRVEFDLNYKGEKVHILFSMGGDFNVANALAAAAAAVRYGLSLEEISEGIRSCLPVNGRFQSVDCGQDFSVIVDYAHTPDEIEKLLQTANKIKKNRIITVCGCGGNRDKGKRPIMGQIACNNSDFVIITSDNPRNEEPMDIIDGITAGIRDKDNYITVCDRAEAINKALSMAEKDDFVIIAGKGHEDYQLIKGVKYHFDDKEVVRKYFGK